MKQVRRIGVPGYEGMLLNRAVTKEYSGQKEKPEQRPQGGGRTGMF